MLWLAVPVLMEQVLAMLVGLSDRILTGHYLDTTHLAAINLMAYVLWRAAEIALPQLNRPNQRDRPSTKWLAHCPRSRFGLVYFCRSPNRPSS